MDSSLTIIPKPYLWTIKAKALELVPIRDAVTSSRLICLEGERTIVCWLLVEACIELHVTASLLVCDAEGSTRTR